MTTIKKDEYVFLVDVERTKQYYKTHSLCECECCRNYYAQIRKKYPKLTDFLEEFGVDVARPDEVMSVEETHFIDYIDVDYTVCGKVETLGNYEIDINDNTFLSMLITEGFATPNEQKGEYFTISVMNIKLPWVLDEPFPKPITQKLPTKKTLLSWLSKWFKNKKA